MPSKAEIRRRKQQSARDKAKHREEQERERRQQQFARDRARHRAEQARLYRTTPLPTPLPGPLPLEETAEVVLLSMDPAIEKTKVPKA